MDKTHTLGPWMWVKEDDSMLSLETENGNGLDTVLFITRCKSCQDRDFDRFRCGIPNDANARLIAAAPELLEALEAVVNAYNEPDKVSMIDSIGKAGDLIAKVNGQTVHSSTTSSRKFNESDSG